MRGSLPAVQSLMAGYADTTGFLALKGLFTSHVTGNFVTLGSALVSGTSGTLGKTLALPTFCVAVFLIRLIGHRLRAAGRPVLRSVLTLQLALMIVAAALAVWAGPFSDPDAVAALALGMILVIRPQLLDEDDEILAGLDQLDLFVNRHAQDPNRAPLLGR